MVWLIVEPCEEKSRHPTIRRNIAVPLPSYTIISSEQKQIEVEKGLHHIVTSMILKYLLHLQNIILKSYQENE